MDQVAGGLLGACGDREQRDDQPDADGDAGGVSSVRIGRRIRFFRTSPIHVMRMTISPLRSGRMEPNRDAVLKAMEQVIDPELRRPVTELEHGPRRRDRRRRRVADDRADDRRVPAPAFVRGRRSTRRSRGVPGVTGVALAFDVMTPEERQALTTKLRGGAAERDTVVRLPKDCRVIAVASGKGGVGKSSLTANLAVAFAAARASGRRARRRRLRPLDSADPRHPPEAGRGRRDDRPAGEGRPEADVDRVLPRRQRAGDVARPDAAPRARAVPHGRPLGRHRRARRRHAARHRRRRHLARAAAAARGGRRRDDAAEARAGRRVACRVDGAEDEHAAAGSRSRT